MRVAIWLQGGIGGGNFSQGYPPLLNFVVKLSSCHQITVYSILSANIDFVPHGFKFRTVKRGISSRKLRTILIFFLFLWDHFKKPYDLIHAFWVYPAGTMAVILGKIIRKPTIVTIQGGEAAALPQIRYGNMLKPWLKKITLWTCEQTTCLNSISTFLVHQLQKHGLKRNDTVVIPFGPEKTVFKKSEKARTGCLHVIHVANLTEVKDQFMLLKAFKIIAEQIPAELKIIGDDYMGAKLQKFAAELGLEGNVKFLGVIPNKDLPDYYAWADIMMHTSLHEGQSGVVMEAMASGVVVCGTRVGIIYDLGDEYFESVAVGDYESLATSVVNVWHNGKRFSALIEKCAAYVYKYDASWTAIMFQALYKKITGVSDE
jgi:glycosyltransferase involved in cell wall biosynthesis